MNRFSTEFRVGLFTLVAALILSYMFFVLSPDTFTSKGTRLFYTVVENASGIVPKTHVKTNGVTVGKVRDIILQVSDTRIELEVEDHVKIPVGSKIAIKEKGLLGDVFMEIIRSDDEGEYVDAEGFIPPAEDQVNLSALLSIAGSIGQDIKQITTALAKVLGNDEGEKNIASIVYDVKGAAASIRAILEENRPGVRNIVKNVENTTASLSSAIGDRKSDLTAIVSNLRVTTDDLKLFAANIRDIVDGDNKAKIEQIIASFDNTMRDVEVTAKSVRLVADKIESGEGTLGRLINDEKTLTELEAAIKDVREILAPATKLKVEVDYHGEYRDDKSTQHYFNVALRTRPDKFYLLGFTDAGETVEDTIIEPVDTSRDDASPDATGTMTKDRRRLTRKNAIRFNAQMAKRWYAAQVRFGLFETTGGIAGDFFLFDDRLQFTVEAFDWDSSSYVRRTAHVKTYLSILFFNHLYTVIGIDDVTRLDQETGKVSKSPNYFLGAGFKFDDNDLKAVFGTASLLQ